MNTTQIATAPRIGRCSKCWNYTSVLGDAEWSIVDCGTMGCAGMVMLKGVKVALSARKDCGPHCTEGTGKACNCTCGGQAHGAAYRIKP